MLSNLFTILVCIGLAVFGAWETARIRHQHNHAHKRRRTDYL